MGDHSDQFGYTGQTRVEATVFFADVLGFSEWSTHAVHRAEQSLDDVALLFSDRDELARFLQQGSPWFARYGISDSLFLLAHDSVAAARAAAEFFFRLAYLNSSVPDQRVLMRGALTRGTVIQRGPIFPETATGNVVGEAIVRVVMLEKSGAKGPRLMVDAVMAGHLRTSGAGWILDDAEGVDELLWLLPPDPADVDLSMLRPVCQSVSDALIKAPDDHAAHYVAYVDLTVRSLLRLAERDRGSAQALLGTLEPDRIRRKLDQLLAAKLPGVRTLGRLDELTHTLS